MKINIVKTTKKMMKKCNMLLHNYIILINVLNKLIKKIKNTLH